MSLHDSVPLSPSEGACAAVPTTAVPTTGAPTTGALSPWPEFGPEAPLRYVFDEADAEGGTIESCDRSGMAQSCAALSLVARAVPCFARSTRIAVPGGWAAVEALRPGDLVLTRDNGPQPLLWAGGRRFGWRDLAMLPLLRPVRVPPGLDGLAAGAAPPGGAGLLVSPNHRLLALRRTPPPGGLGEALVAARDLMPLGAAPQAPAGGIDYLHLLFARHEAILAEGYWCESLRTEPALLAALPGPARAGIAALGLEAPAPFARTVLAGAEATAFLGRSGAD